MVTKGPTQQVLMSVESGTITIWDAPAQVEAITADTSWGIDDTRTDEMEPRLGDVTGSDASALGSLEGPHMDLVMRNLGLSLPRDAALGDTISAPGSLDVEDLGVTKLGLLGYPGALPCLPVGCWWKAA
jgi:hypothetical protein